MSRVEYVEVVLSREGNVLPGVAVSFSPVPGTGATANLWAGETGEAQVSSVLTNSRGVFSVWLDAGRYDVTVPHSETRRVEVVSERAVEEAIAGKEGKEGKEGRSLESTSGVGPPSAVTCPQGATYFQTSSEGVVIAEWLGTSTGPVEVVECAPTASGDLSGAYPHPVVTGINGHQTGVKKVTAAATNEGSAINLANSLRAMAIELGLMKE